MPVDPLNDDLSESFILTSPAESDYDNPEENLLGEPEAVASIIEQEEQKSSVGMAFMNMANSIIGAGVIGQAYAIKEAGFVGGVLLLFLISFVTDWTLRLMVVNSKISGQQSYQQTVKFCYGRWGFIIVGIAQGVFAFGGCMAFCVIIGDTFPHILRATLPHSQSNFISRFLTGRAFCILVCVLGISYPLSLNRDISKLAKASGLALVSMALITITVAVRGPMIRSTKSHLTKQLWTFNTGFFQAVSVISFAFVCHHNTLLIYESLKMPTSRRFGRVVHWSVGISVVACLILGLAGFFSFKTDTKSNILNNFPSNDILANIARFCFGFNMITTLPLEIFVCREVIAEFLVTEDGKLSTKQHFFVTSALVFTATGVSLLTCDLGIILELVGASAASTVAYILPQLCYLKLSTKRWQSLPKLLCYASIAFGTVVMILSTVMTLIHMNDADKKKC